MPPTPKLPSFDTLLAAIKVSPSLGDLERLRETACTYFTGSQREQLEAAVAERETQLPGSEGFG